MTLIIGLEAQRHRIVSKEPIRSAFVNGNINSPVLYKYHQTAVSVLNRDLRILTFGIDLGRGTRPWHAQVGKTSK